MKNVYAIEVFKKPNSFGEFDLCIEYVDSETEEIKEDWRTYSTFKRAMKYAKYLEELYLVKVEIIK